MKAYQIVVEISDPLTTTKKYVSPRVFLFEPFKTDYDYEREFIAKCQLLFATETNVPQEEWKIRSYYKTYETYPFRDYLGRLKSIPRLFRSSQIFFKYAI